jgi:DNA-binding NarL/FixJ family response regulator
MPRQPTIDTPNSDQQWCPVCDATPVVLVALRHLVMRRWTEELLATEHGCWEVASMDGDEPLVDAIARTQPDLVVVDDSDFPSCCQSALHRVPPAQVVVVGPEPDTAYRSLALVNGAGGWVCRDHVGEDLSSAMRGALGCRHGPCPPAGSPTPRTGHLEPTTTRS